MSVFLWSARERLRFPRALWLLPLAISLVFFFNAVRIALLIAVGVYVSPEVALSGFHSKAGWLFFCAIALGLIALAQRTRFFLKPEALQLSAADANAWNPTTTYLLPLLALIATSLATALFASGSFDRFYALRILTVGWALYSQHKHLPAPRWLPSLHAPAIGLVVFALWLWLVPRGKQADARALQEQIGALGAPWAALWLATRALGATVIVPIAEELAFRGFLLRRLIAADFSEVPKTQLTPLALVGSSLAFGALHPGAFGAACLAGVAYALAQQLKTLRERGVLIVGSGNIVHNLRAARWSGAGNQTYDWALEFDAVTGEHIAQGRLGALQDFQKLGALAQQAHPTWEHYLPLLYAAGAVDAKEPPRFFNTSFQLASISMRSVLWG